MNKALYIFVASTLSFCALANEAHGTLKVSASTRDGSTIKGVMSQEVFHGTTFFAESLPLNPSKISSITFLQTNGSSKVNLTNGDTFLYNISNQSVTVESLIGKLCIPCNSLKSLSFENQFSFNTEGATVFSCDFESESDIPGFKGGTIVEGKFGKALHVPPRTSAAKIDLPAGTIGPEGTIEFWGKIDAGARMTTDGCPRFFEIINMDTRHEISQDWNTNNGEAGQGLTFRMDGLPAMVSSHYGKSSYESLLGDASKWHHYALVWNVDGLDINAPLPNHRGDLLRNAIKVSEGNVRKCSRPKAAVFIDGRCVMSTTSECWSGAALSKTSSTLFFPNREDEMPWYGRVGYTIDSFRILNKARLNFCKP